MSESMMGMTTTACIKYLENWKNALIERGYSECSEDVMCLTNAIAAMKSQDGLFKMIDDMRKERDAAVAALKSAAPCKVCKHYGVDIEYCEHCSPLKDWDWRGVTNE